MTIFRKILKFLYQWCSIFHVKDSKNYMYLAADPHLNTLLFQRPHQKQRFDLKMTLKVYSKFATHFHDFSKIADLQAHSAPLGGTLWTCRSAIFQ